MSVCRKLGNHAAIWMVCTVILVGCMSSESMASPGPTDEFVAASQNLNAPTMVPQVLPTVSSVEKKDVLSQIVNDVTVEVTSAKIIKTGVEIGVCYTTLDGGDWYPTPGHLFYGTSEIYPDEYEFTSEVKGTELDPGKRCVLIRYRINDLESVTVPIQFSLIDVAAIPREMPPCQNFRERLATNSKAKTAGLEVQCAETKDGNISVTLMAHNSSLDEGKAI